MNPEVTDYLYKYVINNNQHIQENEISSYEALNNYDLLITFNNGTKEIFDTFANTSRRVHHIDGTKSDKQLRLDFKRRLQVLMNRKRVNQEELAKYIKSTQPMISRYLTGESIPGAITLKKIADALGCSMDDFYEDKY